MITVLLAAPDVPGETEVVASAPALGLRISRRCVDAVDLMAAAAADRESAVVLSAGLPRLTRDVLERIRDGRPAPVIGLAGTVTDRDRLARMGLDEIVMTASTVTDTVRDLRTAIDNGGTNPQRGTGVWSTGVWSASEASAEPAGRIIAAWGPMGAPGRTTVAIGLAESLAAQGVRVGLVDADTYAPSVAMALGLVEDASGLIVACRHADMATLDAEVLVSLCHQVRRNWFALGGIGRPDRWADLRPAALDQLWTACRSAFDVTVVDVGFCLEADDGGAWASRRNAASTSAVTVAEDVLAIANASPQGAARLVSAWPSLTSVAPEARHTIVQNRSGGRGRDRREGWSAALADLGVAGSMHRLPADERSLERCWAGGRSLGEGARRSPLRRAFAGLAGHLVSG